MAVSLTAPTLAVIVIVPGPTIVARPLLSIVATVASDELQVMPVDRSCEEPSV